MMATQTRPNAKKCRCFILFVERFDQIGEMEIRQIVAVVRQENFVAIQIFLYRFQSLANVCICSRVDKCNCPVVDVTIEDLDVSATIEQHEVVRYQFTVIYKVVFDDIGTISEAENEILVPEMGIVLHHVPQNRPVANVDHRLGGSFPRLSDPHTEPAAEKHYLHG